ncbi:MAG: FtsX-like permease family protein [Actinomycetota bacterium]
MNREEGAPILAWLRLDLPRRWRSLTVLALLVAIAAATVLTATAGARRGMTAVARLGDRTLPATTVALPNQPGFDWSKVRALPEVEAMATFAVAGFVLEGSEDADNIDFPWADASIMQTIERPVVLSGRLADPARADEAVVTARFPATFGKGVGDTVVARLLTPEQAAGHSRGVEPGEPAGPRVPLRIVGIVRSTWFSDPGRPGVLTASPGLYKRYPTNLLDPAGGYINALIRLRGGEATLPQFRADLARVSGRGDIDTWNLPEQTRQLNRTLRFEASCLLAFGVAALVAALLLIGQAIARYTAATVEDLRTLRALGMTSRQSAVAAAAGPILAASIGASLGVAAAAVASRWFPIGSAAAFEPTPGMSLDWAVLATGWVLVPVVVLLGALTAAWAASRARQAQASDRRSVVAKTVTRAGLPVPVTVGTRLALETGRGRTAVPVRPALVGAVTGVIGVLAAFTFSGGVADAASNPRRFGQTYQVTSFFGANSEDFGPADQVLAAVSRVPGVDGVDNALLDVANAADGQTTVPLYTYQPVGRPLDVVLTSGRLPVEPADVVLAPSSSAALRAGLGSKVTLSGTDSQPRVFTVTGIGFVPEGPHNSYSTGGWVTRPGYDALFGNHFKFHTAYVSVNPGADANAVLADLKSSADAVLAGASGAFGLATPPTAALQVKQVQRLPLVLGVFLVLLAIGTVGHALATAVRRRRHDLAVLRALGMTRRQTRVVVITQASVLALVGLLFGVPLGLALGRTVWRVVADFTPLQYAPPFAFWALVLIGPVALLVCNLLAAWPGQQATRLRISHILRAE